LGKNEIAPFGRVETAATSQPDYRFNIRRPSDCGAPFNIHRGRVLPHFIKYGDLGTCFLKQTDDTIQMTRETNALIRDEEKSPDPQIPHDRFQLHDRAFAEDDPGQRPAVKAVHA